MSLAKEIERLLEDLPHAPGEWQAHQSPRHNETRPHAPAGMGALSFSA